jgi:pyruvate formate lyase activating enzyme
MSVNGVLFDLKKYAIHDGPGIRTTLFFRGCPLNCRWCHNPESRCSKAEIIQDKSNNRISDPISTDHDRVVGYTVTDEAVLNEILQDEIFYDQSEGGVTFSGGEPMMQIDFLIALLERCKGLSIHTVVDTSGYAPLEDFNRIYDLVDLFLYDLKVMDDASHIKYTGVSNNLIHTNLTALASRGGKVTIRIPLIPDVTDTKENLEAVIEYLEPFNSINHISLLPFNAFGEDKIRRFRLKNRQYHWRTYKNEEISGIRNWLESRGYKVTVGS